MTKTTTAPAPRYRLVTRYGREMAQVQDTGHPDFGVRGRSIAVTRLLPYAEADTIRERLESEYRAR